MLNSDPTYPTRASSSTCFLILLWSNPDEEGASGFIADFLLNNAFRCGLNDFFDFYIHNIDACSLQSTGGASVRMLYIMADHLECLNYTLYRNTYILASYPYKTL